MRWTPDNDSPRLWAWPLWSVCVFGGMGLIALAIDKAI